MPSTGLEPVWPFGHDLLRVARMRSATRASSMRTVGVEPTNRPQSAANRFKRLRYSNSLHVRKPTMQEMGVEPTD